MPSSRHPNAGARLLVLPGAVGAYVVCAGCWIGANPWEPLARELGWGVVLGGSLAVGLLIGRFKALLAVLVLIPLFVLSGVRDPLALLVAPVVLLISASVVAVGVGICSLAARHGARSWARDVGAAMLATALGVTAWGVYLANRVVDNTPAHPVLIGQRDGAFRGIAIGDPVSRAGRLFGSPVRGDPNFAPSPVGVEPADLSGPSSMPNWQTWRYRNLVLFVDQGHIRGYITTDPNAQTAAGVGIGDSLAIARRTYNNLSCFGVTLGDANDPSYLACDAKLPDGQEVWFGGDPINSIWVTQNYDRIPGRPIQARSA